MATIKSEILGLLGERIGVMQTMSQKWLIANRFALANKMNEDLAQLDMLTVGLDELSKCKTERELAAFVSEKIARAQTYLDNELKKKENEIK